VSIPKTTPPRLQIQEVVPQLDCGRYPVKRTVGERVEVTARIFRDGHETLGAAIRHKGPDATRWAETPLEPLGNDFWAGSFGVEPAGRVELPDRGVGRPRHVVPGASCGARLPPARPTSPASCRRARCCSATRS